MDATMDHDTKPPTTSLPIARFPITTGTGTTTTTTTKRATSTTAKKPSAATSGATSGAGGAPSRRRPSGGWAGIRPVERQLMRPWLVQRIDEGRVEGLEWVDAAHTKFRIPWKHGSRQGWRTEQDACLFMLWAQHTGRYRGNEAPNAKRWKANFRCALNSLPDAREVKTQSQTKGQNAYRVYEFLNERKAKVQHTARTPSTSTTRGTKCLTDGIKTEMDATPDTTSHDVKYPLTPTSGSGSGLHQNSNEEPLEHVTYSSSPGPCSPAASYTSTCSSSTEDPYSPASPPPAHQHSISRNWMLHMENESYRAIFPTSSASPASLPVPSTTASSTWGAPPAATSGTNTYRRDVTTTSSPSHAFPASPDHVMTSSTSFPATRVTSQSSVFNAGRVTSSQVPYLTMDIGLSSHIDYDSGLGSPSSSGLGSPTSGFGSSSSGRGSPSSNHSDMEYACSDDGSDVSVEVSKSHLQELKREFVQQTSQDQVTFQQYQHYQQQQQRLQQQQQQQQQHNSYNNLYQMSHSRPHHLQHSTSSPNQHNNQFNLQSTQLAGDYGLVEALQNAFGSSIPEEMASLDVEDVESVLSAGGPYLNVDYKITVKHGGATPSTIEANLTANVHGYPDST